MRQHPRPTHQRRVVPHMLVMPTSQLGHPVVFFILQVADNGLLHGVGWFYMINMAVSGVFIAYSAMKYIVKIYAVVVFILP